MSFPHSCDQAGYRREGWELTERKESWVSCTLSDRKRHHTDSENLYAYYLWSVQFSRTRQMRERENIVPNSYSHRSTLQTRFRSRSVFWRGLRCSWHPEKCEKGTGRLGNKLQPLSSSGVRIQSPTLGEDGQSISAPFVHAAGWGRGGYYRVLVLSGKAKKSIGSHCDCPARCMRAWSVQRALTGVCWVS